MTISKETAEKWLKESLKHKYAPKVNKYDDTYHWTQNEFDALISFAYNIGSIDKLTNYGKRSTIKFKIIENNFTFIFQNFLEIVTIQNIIYYIFHN